MIIHLKNVSLSFHENSSPILQSLNFKVEQGEFIVIIGSNGSGKSSLIKLISGDYSSTKGEVIVKNQKLASYLTQDISISTISELTVLENLILSLLKNKSSSLGSYLKHRDTVSKDLLTVDDIFKSNIDQPISLLSGGQRQIIATFMSLYSCKELLLLDEHTSALDPKTEKKLMAYTAKIIDEKNLTTLMITHKLDDAIKFGNRIIMLHKGRIVEDINKIQKSKMTADQLLNLFHKYEDKILRAEND